MNYEDWRNDIFGQPADQQAVDIELARETYEVPAAEAFDHIDRALADPEIHDLFSKAQIGNGLQIIYSNACSHLPLSYIEGTDEDRRILGIENLRHLYSNYFERYCVAPVERIGDGETDGTIGYLCYMFWDIFVLYPGNATPAMVDAGVAVMDAALKSRNEQCVVSAIHGLGHWTPDSRAAPRALEQWLAAPTTQKFPIIDYARQAMTGCIL